MDFYQALLGRRPQHLAWGGFSGSGDPGIGGGLGQAGSAIAGGWHRASDWAANRDPTSAPRMNTDVAVPTNTFEATMPEIQNGNFGYGMEQGMNGLQTAYGRLGNVYGRQMGLANQAGGTISGLQDVYGQQQSLADALLAQSRGQGPNPAQLQFQQNVNQNIAQQAGALASTRGINPALAARMASQQGAAMNQQAASQSALMQAQQQLAAQGQLAAQQAAMGQNLLGQNSVYGTQGNLYGQAQQTAGQGGQLGNSMYGMAAQGLGAQNNANINASLGVQGINAGVASQNASNTLQGTLASKGLEQANLGAKTSNAATIGGVFNAIGGIMGRGAGKAHGGEIESNDAQALSLANDLMGRGGEVPGKAKRAGDHEENDTVPTVLSPKEIVIPRSIAMSDDAPEKAAEFVSKLKGKSKSKVGPKGYGKILEKHRELKKKMEELDALIERSA